jgi:hypothetical protein
MNTDPVKLLPLRLRGVARRVPEHVLRENRGLRVVIELGAVVPVV